MPMPHLNSSSSIRHVFYHTVRSAAGVQSPVTSHQSPVASHQ
ncbi:hypothetical protein CKA32_006098 [Geitlerinema sp. FC II]|nr:hypothetical protein CKA32_006098 [Geitlerinema sp. FC II]